MEPVNDRSELENDQPVSYQNNASRTIFHERLAAEETWTFSVYVAHDFVEVNPVTGQRMSDFGWFRHSFSDFILPGGTF
jgi:hypothetical protein